jgi:hypothetical protein
VESRTTNQLMKMEVAHQSWKLTGKVAMARNCRPLIKYWSWNLYSLQVGSWSIEVE